MPWQHPASQQTQHTSSQSVESSGAILFRLSTRETSLLHLLSRNEYLPAKGRRNLGESLQQAALREVGEETGRACYPLPVTMGTRAPPLAPAIESGDEARVNGNSTEPFSLQIRRLDAEANVKMIWWFFAAVEEGKTPKEDRPGEERFEVGFYRYEDAVSKLTYQGDKGFFEQTIAMVKATSH